MGFNRNVNTNFWTDDLVVDSFTPEDKYFYLYLLTCPQSRMAGIYRLSKKIAAFELGYSVDAVSGLLDRFANKYGRIVYSDDTQEVAIMNYIKHTITAGGKPVYDCIRRDLKDVKNRDLIVAVLDALQSIPCPGFALVEIIAVFAEAVGVAPAPQPTIRPTNRTPIRTTNRTPNRPSSALDYSSFSEPVLSALKLFEEHRKAIKKPLTQNALNLIAKNLAALDPDPDNQVAIIERSIANGWTGVFPLKDAPRQPAKATRWEGYL